jgi:hypothetical protein
MALTLRKNTGNNPLTYDQLDNNFEYFTGSYMSASHVPGVLTFDSVSTPITGSGQVLYSSSGYFYFNNI